MCKISAALAKEPKVKRALDALARLYGSNDTRGNLLRACDEAYGTGSQSCVDGDLRLLQEGRLPEAPEYVMLVLQQAT